MLSRPKCLALVAALVSAASAADASAWVCLPGTKQSSYAIESGAVVYRTDPADIGTRVVGADPHSFRLLERDDRCVRGGYARDRHAIYYEGVKVPGADPQSFEPVEKTYAKDRAWWYGAGKPIASRRGGELRILGEGGVGYAIHAEGVFYGARRVEAEGFEVLGRRGYARSRNRAYFRGEEIPGIDAASFSVLPKDELIAKDKRRIVIMGRVEDRFDAASFEVLDIGALFKDRNHVYFVDVVNDKNHQLKPIEGADAARFAVIGHTYWRDGKSVYYGEKAIAGADPDSFRLVHRDGGHGVDKHRIYSYGVPLADRDPASFQVLGDDYSKDRNGVYYRDRPLRGADPGSFSLIRHGYSKDRGRVYFYGRPLRGADPESFSVVMAERGRDKSYGYQYDKRVCAWTREASPALPMCDPAQYLR